MFTAVVILILASMKDEISGLIDLYSTLQGNLRAYTINYLITTTVGAVEFYYSFWIMSRIDEKFWMYMGLMTIVNIFGALFGVYIISRKNKIKNWIRKKKISKTQKKRWADKKMNNNGEGI